VDAHHGVTLLVPILSIFFQPLLDQGFEWIKLEGHLFFPGFGLLLKSIFRHIFANSLS